MEYVVAWAINITADSPEEAAQKALLIQRDSDSTAVVFDVFNTPANTAWGEDLFWRPKIATIDLSQLDLD